MNGVVSSGSIHSSEGGRHRQSGHSMQHVICKLFSDGRSPACDCSIWINPISRAAPKRQISSFKNFVETLTRLAPAEPGNEDRARETRFVVTPPPGLYLRCSPRPQASALLAFEHNQGSQPARWIGLPYATNRRRTRSHVFSWFATHPCIHLRSIRDAWINSVSCEIVG